MITLFGENISIIDTYFALNFVCFPQMSELENNKYNYQIRLVFIDIDRLMGT